MEEVDYPMIDITDTGEVLRLLNGLDPRTHHICDNLTYFVMSKPFSSFVTKFFCFGMPTRVALRLMPFILMLIKIKT